MKFISRPPVAAAVAAPSKTFKPTTRTRLLPDQISDLAKEVAALRERVAALEAKARKVKPAQ